MAQQQPSTKPADPAAAHASVDEIIHVPGNKHRARWVMLILLLFLILTTFTVGPQVVDLMTGKGRSAAYVTWNHPSEGLQSISYDEWMGVTRSLKKMYTLLGADLQDKDIKDVASSTIVLSALGERAGVAFTDTELGAFITRRFEGARNYHALLPRFDLSAKEFESTLRRYFVGERYRSLLVAGWRTPELEAVKTSWKNQHQEYAFDYVELPVAGVLEELKAQRLGDEELQQYFDGLPQDKKDRFKTPEKLSAEIAGLNYTTAPAELLFTKYPKAADEAELEAQAQKYYQDFRFSRFRNPRPTSAQDFVLPYEGLAVQARAEAVVHNSLVAWLKDLRVREGQGEALDLAAEAGLIGLALHRIDPPKTQEEWIADKSVDWLGTDTPGLIFGNTTDALPGKLYTSIIVDKTGFTLPRILTKEAETLPAFEELKDKLREEIWNNRAKDAAKTRLEALRDQFGTRPVAEPGQPAPPIFMPQAEEAAFYDVARKAGYEAKLRDFKERVVPPSDPPVAFDLWMRIQPSLYSEKVGSVVPAGIDTEGKHAFLARVRGVRDPDLMRMKPNEFDALCSSAGGAGGNEFQLKAFSLAGLQAQYGLTFADPKGGE